MGTIAADVNLATDDVTESDLDPQAIYAEACWHVQYDDGAVRVFGYADGEIHLLGKCAVNDDGRIYAAAGQLPWKRLARALSQMLSSAAFPNREIRLRDGLSASDLEPETTKSEPFFTFDFDTATDTVTNISRAREATIRETSSGTRWQVVVTTSTVMVFAHERARVMMIGRSRREKDSSLFVSKSFSPALDTVGWPRIARAVVIASAQRSTPTEVAAARPVAQIDSPDSPPRDAPAELPLADKYPNTTIVYPRPPRRLSSRHFVVGAIGAIYFLVLLYLLVRAGKVVGAFPLRGAHAAFVPLFMIIAPLTVAIGLLVASSPRALADNQRRRETGRVHPGPRSSAGMGVAFVGTLLGLYPIGAIRTAESTAPPRTVATVPTSTPTPSSTPTTVPAPPAPLITPDAPPPTLAETITHLKPTLGDGIYNAGVRELARFASMHLAWRDVAITDAETTIPLVLKDPDPERGKRLCATGSLTDIERADLDNRPAYTGTLRTVDGDDVRFIAVGSTGSLVKRSTGTICGVVTGRADKAVMLVGMFDLPENAMPAVER